MPSSDLSLEDYVELTRRYAVVMVMVVMVSHLYTGFPMATSSTRTSLTCRYNILSLSLSLSRADAHRSDVCGGAEGVPEQHGPAASA
jgi:hypothetical protein